MELLATVHWVGAEKGNGTYEEVANGVLQWNARKREIMKPTHIKKAYDRLVAEKWLEAA